MYIVVALPDPFWTSFIPSCHTRLSCATSLVFTSLCRSEHSACGPVDTYADPVKLFLTCLILDAIERSMNLSPTCTVSPPYRVGSTRVSSTIFVPASTCHVGHDPQQARAHGHHFVTNQKVHTELQVASLLYHSTRVAESRTPEN